MTHDPDIGRPGERFLKTGDLAMYQLLGIFLNGLPQMFVVEACELNHYVIKLQRDEWGRYIPDGKRGVKKIKLYGHVEIVMLYDYSENANSVKLFQQKLIERKTIYVTRTTYLADSLNLVFKRSGCESRAAGFTSRRTGEMYQRVIWTFDIDALQFVSERLRAWQARNEQWATHLAPGKTIENQDFDRVYADHHERGLLK